MKVELSIADDKELRQHIKDVIREEVLSVARAEIKNIIAEAVRDKVIPSTQEQLDRLVSDAIAKQVVSALEHAAGGTSIYQLDRLVKNTLENRISDVLNKWLDEEFRTREVIKRKREKEIQDGQK